MSKSRLADCAPRFADNGRSAELKLVNRSAFTGTGAYTFRAALNGAPVAVEPPDIGPLETGSLQVALPEPVRPGDRLRVDGLDARGTLVDRVAVEEPLPWPQPARGRDLTWAEEDGRLTVTGGGYTWALDTETGLLAGGGKGSIRIVEGGPYLTATRQRTRGSTPCTGWTLLDVSRREDEQGLVVRAEGRYDQAEGAFVYTFDGDGRLRLEYDFTWLLTNSPPTRSYHKPPESGEMREVGVTFALNHAFQKLEWDKKSHWTWYPDDHIGRPRGTAYCFAESLPGYHGLYDRAPWHLEENEFGTRDFRSTKTGVRRARLAHPSEGAALAFYSDGSQAARSYYDPEAHRVQWTLVDQYGGGHEQFLQGNGIYSTPRIILDAGSRLQGSALLYLE